MQTATNITVKKNYSGNLLNIWLNHNVLVNWNFRCEIHFILITPKVRIIINFSKWSNGRNLRNDRIHPLMKLECIIARVSFNACALPSISLSKQEAPFLQKSNSVYMWLGLKDLKKAINLMLLI